MSGCLCSLVTIAWSPPDRGSGHPLRCMAKDSVSDHALHSFPTLYHTRPASWGTTAALMCSVCWLGVDYIRKGRALCLFLRSRSSLSPTAPSRYRLYSCPPYGTCQSAHRLTDRQEPGKKVTHTQSASCSDTELRLCLNNLYLPPDTRIE
jgi:hypothetical protein